MAPQSTFVLANIIGGVAVLGSYALGLSLYPQYREALWGNVHGNLRLIFALSMLLAAAGYLIFCYVYIRQVGSDPYWQRKHLGSYSISWLSIVFLASASFWMPGCIAYIHTRQVIWWVVSVTSLWITALSLLAMTWVTSGSLWAPTPTVSKYYSVVGLAYTTFHCLVIDAIVWVYLFKR